MTDQDLKSRADAVCARLLSEISKLGIGTDQLPHLPVYEQAGVETSKDPYSGEETVCVCWKDRHGNRLGEIKFHGDGSFYAEYDVVAPHPTDPRWFVEGVTAWGRGDVIKSEAKLLEVPEDA